MLVFHDVTERRRAREALRESEERLRLFIGHAPASLAMFDRSMRYLSASRRWLTDYNLEQTDLTGLSHYEVFPEISEKWKEVHRRALDGEVVRAESDRFDRTDGSVQWLCWEVRPWYDAAGDVGGIVIFSEDITERQQLLETIESVARFPDENPNPILRVSSDGKLLYANRSSATLLKSLGWKPAETLPGDWRQHALQALSSGCSKEMELTCEEVVYSLLLVPVSDLEYLNIYGRDISERKHMEEQLRKSRDELELRVQERTTELSTANENLREQAELLDLAHDAILVRDMDNNILYWNDGAEKTYGWTKEEALGKAAHTLLYTHFPRPLEELMADLLRNEEWEGELGHKTKSGEQIMVASRWAIQKGPEGNPTGMLEINRNISERKQAEEQVKSYMAKLEQSNQALQDFASIASHDLKEPLRKVISFGNMLRQRSGDSLGQSGNDYLNRMLNATERMQSLLTGLLDYSRVATASEPFKEVDLSDLIGEVLSDLEVRIVKTGGEVHVGTLPVISADPTQMRQLFQNLIGNALKFHKPGEKPMVQVRSVSNTDSECQIVVEDNGIGFDEQYLDKIFAPFQRLHARSEYEGTGMGLAICKKIVERHGGSIIARSTPGAGSEFIVTLPARPQKD